MYIRICNNQGYMVEYEMCNRRTVLWRLMKLAMVNISGGRYKMIQLLKNYVSGRDEMMQSLRNYVGKENIINRAYKFIDHINLEV